MDGTFRKVGTMLVGALVAGLLMTTWPAAAGASSTAIRGCPVGVVLDVAFANPSGVPLALDVYRPLCATHPVPAVVFIHGGGWRLGDKSSKALDATYVAKAGFVVFVPNYRLSPQWTGQAPVDDVESAIVWVRTNGATYGADGSRIGIVGLSAGGNLGQMAAYEYGGIDALVSWSGPSDLAAMWDAGVARRDLGDHMGCSKTCTAPVLATGSPLTYVPATAPPSDLYGSYTDFVPISQQQVLSTALTALGVESRVTIEPSGHADAYSSLAMGPSIDFLKAHLGA